MSKWEVIEEELRGAVSSKFWVTDGENIALFKSDLDHGIEENQREVIVSQLAADLGISCVRVEYATIYDVHGIVSYDFKQGKEHLRFIAPSSLHKKDSGFTLSANDVSKSKTREVSFECVEKGIPIILPKFLDMCFLDCLVGNIDRHLSNWELVLDNKGDVIDMAPLFDHGMSFRFAYDDIMWDRAKVKFLASDEFEPSLMELFDKLAKKFPIEASRFIEKCKTVILPANAKPRLKRMLELLNE